MGEQKNYFFGPVKTGGFKGKTVIINQSADSNEKTLTEVAQEITELFDFFERVNPSSSVAETTVGNARKNQPGLNNPQIIEEAITGSPTLKERILAAGSAASLETIKVLLPPLGIAIEAIKGYQSPNSA